MDYVTLSVGEPFNGDNCKLNAALILVLYEAKPATP